MTFPLRFDVTHRTCETSHAFRRSIMQRSRTPGFYALSLARLHFHPGRRQVIDRTSAERPREVLIPCNPLLSDEKGGALTNGFIRTEVRAALLA